MLLKLEAIADRKADGVESAIVVGAAAKGATDLCERVVAEVHANTAAKCKGAVSRCAKVERSEAEARIGIALSSGAILAVEAKVIAHHEGRALAEFPEALRDIVKSEVGVGSVTKSG